MAFENIFITVGTTDFDDLIREINCEAFMTFVKKQKSKKIVLQIGRGSYYPSYLEEECKKISIDIEIYRFKSTLLPDMKSATIIISHAGAGSISEALSLKKILLIVVNDTLMNNHQTELANAMVSRGYCKSCVVDTCLPTLVDMASSHNETLVTYPDPDLHLFPVFVGKALGFIE
eukprot:gene5048-10113_t